MDHLYYIQRLLATGANVNGRTAVIQLLADRGAKLDAHDSGSRDSINGALLGKTWIPLDWARGIVRVGVQSAIPHPEAEKLLIALMTARGLPIPPPPTSSICLTKGLDGSPQGTSPLTPSAAQLQWAGGRILAL